MDNKQLKLDYRDTEQIIVRVGNGFSQVYAPDHVLKLLHKSLTLYDEECQYSDIYDAGVDYQRSSLLRLPEALILSGLLDILEEKLKSLNLDYQLQFDNEFVPIKMSVSPDLLDGITLRDYQIQMIINSFYYQRGIIESDTGSGKSAMIAGISKLLTTELNANKVVIVVGKVTLLNQMNKMLTSYNISSSMVGADHKFRKSKIMIGISNSLFRSIEKNNEVSKFISEADAIIFDECLPGSTLISTEKYGHVRINGICDSSHITKVSSYNIKTGKIEECKIIRKIKSTRDVTYVTIKVIPKIIHDLIKLIDKIVLYLSKKFCS